MPETELQPEQFTVRPLVKPDDLYEALWLGDLSNEQGAADSSVDRRIAYGKQIYREDTIARKLAEMIEGKLRMFGIKDKGKLIATCSAEILDEDPKLAYFQSAAVIPKYRKQGLNARVNKEALSWVKERGCTKAIADILANNLPSLQSALKGFYITRLAGLDVERPIFRLEMNLESGPPDYTDEEKTVSLENLEEVAELLNTNEWHGVAIEESPAPPDQKRTIRRITYDLRLKKLAGKR